MVDAETSSDLLWISESAASLPTIDPMDVESSTLLFHIPTTARICCVILAPTNLRGNFANLHMVNLLLSPQQRGPTTWKMRLAMRTTSPIMRESSLQQYINPPHLGLPPSLAPLMSSLIIGWYNNIIWKRFHLVTPLYHQPLQYIAASSLKPEDSKQLCNNIMKTYYINFQSSMSTWYT